MTQPDRSPKFIARLEHLLALDAKRRWNLNADLRRFRQLIMPRPEALRRELRGFAEERRTALSRPAQAALDVLCTHPSYLGPLGFTREETSHTRFLAWLLGPARETALGDGPARAVWSVLHRAWHEQSQRAPRKREANLGLASPVLPPGGRSLAEVDLGPPGRIDVDWIFPGARVLIEGKVDAEPSPSGTQRYQMWLKTVGLSQADHSQLERYRTWLSQRRRKARAPALVLLDLGVRSATEADEEDSNSRESASNDQLGHRTGVEESCAIAVSWRDILRAIIPTCHGSSDAHRSLRAWLKSLAIIEQFVSPGPWHQWDVGQQLLAVESARRLSEEGVPQ